MTATETLWTACEACGTTFGQPDDPGRKRVFCSNACRQRAYRARGGRASGTRRESPRARARREEQEAWAREEARREKERQRSQRRRSGASTPPPPPGAVPRWAWPQDGEDAARAKRRRTCRLLFERATHASTDPNEAAACREKADKIRATYGL